MTSKNPGSSTIAWCCSSATLLLMLNITLLLLLLLLLPRASGLTEVTRQGRMELTRKPGAPFEILAKLGRGLPGRVLDTSKLFRRLVGDR